MSEEKIVKVNYSGNSHRERDAKAAQEPVKEQPKVQKIEGVKATKRKKPLGRKVAETFNGEDMSNVGSFVLFEVILPELKNLLFNAASQGLERKLYGTTSRRSSATRSGSPTRVVSHTPYNKMSSTSTNLSGKVTEDISRRARANHDFEEILFEDRGMAEEALERLRDLISEYEVAKVADFYELVGQTSPFTDNKWGWNDLREARVHLTRGGYILDLPRPQQID